VSVKKFILITLTVIILIFLGFVGYLVINPKLVEDKSPSLYFKLLEVRSIVPAKQTLKIDETFDEYGELPIHFKIDYPTKWYPSVIGPPVGTLQVSWRDANLDQKLILQWVTPKFPTGLLLSSCKDICNKVGEVTTKQNLIVEIWRPTKEQKDTLRLPDKFLEGTISNSNKNIQVIFYGYGITVEEFEDVIKTFEFTN